MTPLEELAGYISRGQTVPFPWVVEHCPNGTLHEVWTGGGRHVDNIARLELLYHLDSPRKRSARVKKAVLAIVAADGATVESHWSTEDGATKFSTDYVRAVLRVVPQIAKELSRRRIDHERLYQLYGQVREAAVNDACAALGEYRARLGEHNRPKSCYWFDTPCPRHVPHEDVARNAGYLLYDGNVTPFLDEVAKNISEVAIRRAILAAVPALPPDEALATRTP